MKTISNAPAPVAALLITFSLTLAIFAGAVQAAPLAYTEPPDLTSNLAIPDNLGPLDLGSNTISGSTSSTGGPIEQGDDADSFAYSVPAGMVATSFELVISNFAATDGNTGRARTFSGGTSVERFSADITYPNLINTGTGYLAAGTYDFQVQNEHQLDLNTNEFLGTVSYDWDVTINVVADTDVDIALAAAASIDPAVAGSSQDNLVVTLTARNNGPSDATGVVVDTTWLLPAGVTPTSFVPSQGTIDGAGVWTIGNLTVAQGDVTLVATLTVGPDTVPGTDVISGTAQVSAADQNDWNADNDSIAEAVSVRATTATFRIAKDYGAETGPAVDVQLTCNGQVMEVGNVSDGGFVSLTADGFLQDGFGVTNCSVTETVPAGFSPTYSADCNVVAEDGAANATEGDGVYACTITNALTQATFLVTKSYSDGNDDEVEVTLSCNNGLPLEQSFLISDGNPVNFVITNFTEGEVDCEVTETGTADGYTPSYDNGSVVSDLSCAYADVASGAFSCAITNNADPATFTVYKEWVIAGAVGHEVLEEAQVTIYCNNEIQGGGSNGSYYYLSDTLVGDGDSLTATVDTTLQSAQCWAEEDLFESGAESENDCGSRNIAAGGSSSCTITNTVFFESIPTLSQYGLAVMALLMLGLGFVGFRRFV